MLARLFRWLGRNGKATERDATLIPAGAILLNGAGGKYRFEVVGQASHQAPLEAIYEGHRGGGTDCRVIAALVPEPGHNYNAHAISVSIRGHKVAHFSRGEGKRYGSLIAGVARRGPVACRASVRVSLGADAGPREFRVFLDLAAPSKAAPPEREAAS